MDAEQAAFLEQLREHTANNPRVQVLPCGVLRLWDRGKYCALVPSAYYQTDWKLVNVEVKRSNVILKLSHLVVRLRIPGDYYRLRISYGIFNDIINVDCNHIAVLAEGRFWALHYSYYKGDASGLVMLDHEFNETRRFTGKFEFIRRNDTCGNMFRIVGKIMYTEYGKTCTVDDGSYMDDNYAIIGGVKYGILTSDHGLISEGGHIIRTGYHGHRTPATLPPSIDRSQYLLIFEFEGVYFGRQRGSNIYDIISTGMRTKAARHDIESENE